MERSGWAPAVALVGGAVVGWVAGRWSDGACGRGGYYGGYPMAPAYPAYPYGCNPGYGGYPDRPRHEDKQDERIACLMAESAANRVRIEKDEVITKLLHNEEHAYTDAQVFRGTCLKPDGRVYLPANEIAPRPHKHGGCCDNGFGNGYDFF